MGLWAPGPLAPIPPGAEEDDRGPNFTKDERGVLSSTWSASLYYKVKVKTEEVDEAYDEWGRDKRRDTDLSCPTCGKETCFEKQNQGWCWRAFGQAN